MSNKSEISIGNTWFFPVLALIFITLKLVGVITWSWWWVLAPLWAPLAILIILLVDMGATWLILRALK